MLRQRVILLIVSLLLAGCAGQQESIAPGDEQGPALIVFYTDN